MVKFILVAVALLVVGSASISIGATIPETSDNGMKFLGTWTGRLNPDGTYNPREYHVDIQSRSWVEAKSQCRRQFPNGNLVSIESPDELAFLAEQLEQHGSGKYYFIGATYSSSKGWIWDSNGLPVAQFVLNSIPGPPYHSQETVVIDYQGPHDTKFGIASKTNTNVFICEVDRSECGCNP